MKKFSLFFLLPAIFLFLSWSSVEAAWFGEFALPMEKGLSFSEHINEYFKIVTDSAFGGAFYKAGFFFALFLAIIQIGFGQSREGLTGFGAYLFILLLFVAPIFGGKSFLIKAADASDSLTATIVSGIGGLDPRYAGSGLAVMQAINNSESETYAKNQAELSSFKKQCYDTASRVYFSKTSQTASGPSDTKLDKEYTAIVMDPSITPMPGVYVGSLSHEVTCSEYKDYLLGSLQQSYRDTLSAYENAIKKNELTLTTADQAVLDALNNVTGEELLNGGVSSVKAAPKDSRGGFWSQAWDLLTNLDQTLMNLIMIFPRIIITTIGITFFYIFDYYIWQAVIVLKIVAAIGMALGVLYFMFLRKPDLPLAALGIWVFSNGLYIIAAIALKGFAKKTLEVGNIQGSVDLLLGTKGIFNDALFSIALLGIAATTIAGILSWKGISFTLYFMGNAAAPVLKKL